MKKIYKFLKLLPIVLLGLSLTGYACTAPTAGTILGPDTVCTSTPVTFTDPTGTLGGTWISSNTGVAMVGSLTGIVTGVSAGTAIISYQIVLVCGTATATRVITVLTGPVPLTGNDNPICAGQTTDTLHDLSGGGVWSSNNLAVAVVGTNGVVHGVAQGTAIISYTLSSNGCFATEEVTVNPLPAPIVGPANICEGLTLTLTDPTSGGVWVSNSPGIASVDSFTGLVTAIAHSGGVSIRYILPTGCQSLALHFITVQSPPSSIYNVYGAGFYEVMCQGDQDTLNIAFPSGGTWSSSVPAVATVADLGYPLGGLVYGVSGGTSIISYTIVSCPPATDTVLVNPLPAPIDGLTSICIGLPISLSDSSVGGTWMSSDTSVAYIDTFTGVVTVNDTTLGLTTQITYTLPTGCFINTIVTTNSSPHPIMGPDTVCQGAWATLTDSTGGGTWSSSELSIAQVIDSIGLVDGILAGSVNISYTLSSGCYATIPFRVKPPIPASVSITENPAGIVCAGTPVTFSTTWTNAGTPTFQWQKFYLGITDSTRDSLVYTPIHGDVIICQLVTHGICSVRDTVYDTAAINVYPNNVAPIINITTNDTAQKLSDSSNRLWYPGQIITFFADVTWGGTMQSFQWYENGLLKTGATASSYATAVYGDDTVYCVVTGNPPCDPTSNTSSSNKMYILGHYLGVNNVTSSGGLSLFPNPNNGGFTLSGPVTAATGETLRIEVSDVLGNIVHVGSATVQNGSVNEQINLGDQVANGTYILRIGSASVNEVFHFVINR